MTEKFVVQIVEGGRITIPKPVRDVMHLKQGDYVRVEVLEKVKKNEGI